MTCHQLPYLPFPLCQALLTHLLFSPDTYLVMQMRSDMISFVPKPSAASLSPPSSPLPSSSDQAALLRLLLAHFRLPGGVSTHIQTEAGRLLHHPALTQQCLQLSSLDSSNNRAHDKKTLQDQNTIMKDRDSSAADGLNWSYLKDVLRDVGGLLYNDPTSASSQGPTPLATGQSLSYAPAICGTSISVTSNHFAATALPIRLDLAVVITMRGTDTSAPLVHTFSMDELINMYAWVRAIRKAIDLHQLHQKPSEETKCSTNCHHATNDIASDSIDLNYYGAISYMKEGKLIACNGHLNASQMTLKLTNTASKALDVINLDLTQVDTIALSRDYEPVTSHVLTVSVMAVFNLPAPKKKKQIISTYIVVRAKGNENTQTVVSTDKNPYWNLHFSIKLSVEQLDNDECLKRHGFLLFLFSGSKGNEEIIGQSFVSYSDVLSLSPAASGAAVTAESKRLYSVTDLCDVLQESQEEDEEEVFKSSTEKKHNETSKVWQQRQFDMFMDMDMAVEVDVHSGRDLLAHTTPSMLKKTLSLLETAKTSDPDSVESEGGGGRNPYVVVSFVSSSGEELVGEALPSD